jgi:hypothetical protein
MDAMHDTPWQEIRRRKERRRRRKKAKMKKTRHGKVLVLRESGPPCPRCKQATQVREHAAITEKQLRQPFYYLRCIAASTPTAKRR